MSPIESQYYSLLNSGDLLEMFPESKGNWESDKKFFTKYYEDNQKLLTDNYLDLDDDQDDEFSDSEDFGAF